MYVFMVVEALACPIARCTVTTSQPAAISPRGEVVAQVLQRRSGHQPDEGGGLGELVLVADLSQEQPPRWPWFAPAALEAGARALFAWPVQVGLSRIGVLSLYRADAGGLSRAQCADARLLAAAAAMLLTLYDKGYAPDVFMWALGDESLFRAEAHQAVGALMAELGVDADDAMARLRAYAYAVDEPISKVAEDTMARRLRADSDGVGL